MMIIIIIIHIERHYNNCFCGFQQLFFCIPTYYYILLFKTEKLCGVHKLRVKMCVFMIIYNDLIKDKHKLQKSTVNVNNEYNLPN